MKNLIQLNVTSKRKILFILEITLIAIVVLFNIVEIILTFNYSRYTSKIEISKQYIYIYNNLNINKYTADLKIVSSEEECDNLGYQLLPLYKINKLINASLQNITNEIFLKDYINQTNILNSTFRGKQIYAFDFLQEGNENIEFLMDYVFMKWKGAYFCELKLNLDNDAIFISEKDKKCSMDNKDPILDCGDYFDDKYKLCIIQNKISFSNGTNVVEHFKLSKASIENEELRKLICPVTGLEFNGSKRDIPFGSNEKLQDKNTLKLFKFNENKENFYFSTITGVINKQTYANLEQTSFLPLMDKIHVDTTDNINLLKNIFSKNVDYLSFNEFYNQTFYDSYVNVSETEYDNKFSKFTQRDFINYNEIDIVKSKFYNKNSKVEKKDDSIAKAKKNFLFYNPLPMSNLNESAFFIPQNYLNTTFENFNLKNDQINDNFNEINYKPLSKEIVEQKLKEFNFYLVNFNFPLASESFLDISIHNKSILNYAALFQDIFLDFIDEMNHTLISWLFIKLFILFYFEYKIRITIILNSLKNEISQPDFESEAATNYTAISLLSPVILIEYFVLITKKSKTDKMINKIEYIIKHSAFSGDSFYDFLITYYLDFIKELNKDVVSVLILAILSFIFIIIITIIFTINKFEKKEDAQEHEKLKLD